MSIVLVVVVVPLAANTVATYLLTVLTARAQATAQDWISSVPGAEIQGVNFVSTDLYIQVQTPQKLPPIDSLLNDLDTELPDGITVIVTTSLGERIDVGKTGG